MYYPTLAFRRKPNSGDSSRRPEADARLNPAEVALQVPTYKLKNDRVTEQARYPAGLFPGQDSDLLQSSMRQLTSGMTEQRGGPTETLPGFNQIGVAGHHTCGIKR